MQGKEKTLLFSIIEDPLFNRRLGIYRIAHVLRDEGLDVEVIEFADFWTLEQLQELWRQRYRYDIKFIGFSNLITNWPPVLEEFCGWIKKHYPAVKILFGSASFTPFKSQYIDYYVRGFGEHAMVALLKWVSGNGTRPRFMVPSPDGKLTIDAINSYPAFPMSSLMVKYQDRDFIDPGEWLGIEFSRGCKFECTFCNFPVLGVKGDYTRDADDFRLQVQDAYDRFGVQNYLVSDETFNDRTEKITKFADVVERLDFDMFFTGYIRGDLLVSRPRDREELLRMNFLGHYYGLETFQKESARAVGKGMDGERLKTGLIDVKNYFQTHGSNRFRGEISLIIGLPYEPVESLNETKQWLLDNWQGQSFTAYPLEISRGKSQKLSVIGQDPAKYGYRFGKPERQEKLERFIQRNNFNIKSISIGDFDEVMFWENDHMDFHDACVMLGEWTKVRFSNGFKPGVYQLGNRLNTYLSVNDRLALTQNDLNQVRYNLTNVQAYINKKLSL